MADQNSSGRRRRKVSRRRFIAGGGATLSGAALMGTFMAGQEGSGGPTAGAPPSVAHIRLTVNGVPHQVEVPHYVTLAEVLRDQLGFTGVKIGCNRGECGACTVILDGQAVYSCSQIAALFDGAKITTIEGLAHGDDLDPIQQAFIDHDALQCGFCTPGQIMASRALLSTNADPTEAEIRRGLSGNLCRCGCYNHIVAAVQTAAKAGSRKG